MKTIIITSIAFCLLLFSVSCSAKQVKKAMEKEIEFANRAASLRESLTVALDKYPPNSVEDNAILQGIIVLLPTQWEQQVTTIIEQTSSAREALERIRDEYTVRWEQNARVEAEALGARYLSAKNKDEKTWQNMLAIGGSLLSVLTGGAWLRSSASLTQVVTGVQDGRAQLYRTDWDKNMKPNLDRTTSDYTKRKINRIVNRRRPKQSS